MDNNFESENNNGTVVNSVEPSEIGCKSKLLEVEINEFKVGDKIHVVNLNTYSDEYTGKVGTVEHIYKVYDPHTFNPVIIIEAMFNNQYTRTIKLEENRCEEILKPVIIDCIDYNEFYLKRIYSFTEKNVATDTEKN